MSKIVVSPETIELNKVRVVEEHHYLCDDYIVNPKNYKEFFPDSHIIRHLDETGLPFIGSEIKHGDCIVAMIRNYKNNSHDDEDVSLYSKTGSEGRVVNIEIKHSKNLFDATKVVIITLEYIALSRKYLVNKRIRNSTYNL